MNIRKTASEFYLLYVNEYLTVEKIAEHQGISEELARLLISEGKKINNDNWHPDK
jgi:hypothetical protein